MGSGRVRVWVRDRFRVRVRVRVRVKVRVRVPGPKRVSSWRRGDCRRGTHQCRSGHYDRKGGPRVRVRGMSKGLGLVEG